MDWLKEAKKEDFPEQHQHAIELIGLANFIRLAQHYRKGYLYFGHIDRIEGVIKERFIVKHFTGSNHDELRQATGWSIQTIYEKLRNRRDARQIDAFAEVIRR